MIKYRGRAAGRGFTLIELMIVIAIIAILAAILVPNFVRARGMAQLTGCKSNLKNIATALEAYCADYGGHYPLTIGLITPNYIKALPACPATAIDTYTPSYLPQVVPDAFMLGCDGTNHVALGVTADYPQWDSGRGLVERVP